MKKREFIKTLGLAGLSIPLGLEGITTPFTSENIFIDQSLSDEDFWAGIRKLYTLKQEYINLENGWYNILPQPIYDAHLENIKSLNTEGSYYMRTKMTNDRMQTRKLLSAYLNCNQDEIIITRNTTESMNTIISGIDWKNGDEAIMAEHDYGAMLDMFKQISKRYGMTNKILQIPLLPESDEDIVSLYEKAITPKTKLIMICHIVNISGQILPVKKICDMAHKYGVKVLVDGAHAIAHIDFKINDLNCDYYASSLHKWMSVPLGAGLLYVKKENVAEIWPLNGESNYAVNDIMKLNHTGTAPIHVEMTIPNAIEFQNNLGIKRKEDRLRLLQNRWTSQVKDVNGIIINTPLSAERSCAIANVGIKDMKPSQLAEKLLKNHKIWTVAIDGGGVHGCRITPNIYNTLEEMDALANALKEIAAGK